jgi:hypothetical protein
VVHAENFEVISHIVTDLFSGQEKEECDDPCQGLGYRPRKMPQAVGGEEV